MSSMEQVTAFLGKDLFVVKGVHVTVGLALVALVVAWWLMGRKGL